MSRKKLNSLLAVLLVIMYALCFFISYRGSVSYVYNDFRFSTDEFELNYNNSLYDITDTADNSSSADDYKFKNCTSFDYFAFQLSDGFLSYPFVLAVYDENNQLISKSDILIEIQKGDEIQIIKLGEYLSQETKKELSTLLDNYTYMISRVDCFINDGEIIPVNVYFTSFSSGANVTEKFKITDNEVTDVFYTDDYAKAVKHEYIDSEIYSIQMSNYDLLENKANQKIYKKLNDYINSEELYENAKEIIGSSASGGGGYSGVDSAVHHDIIELNDGKKYYVYYEINHNVFNDVINSYVFRYLAVSQTVIFLLITVVVFLVANKYYTKSKRLNDSRNAFVSAAAHELKTPLCAIQNNSECIIENISPDKNEKYITAIHNESVRMSTLVSKLLQYNRLTLASDVKKSQCSLTDIVKREVEEYKTLIEEKHLSLDVNIDEEVIISANEDMIALAVDNFFSNAVKFTSDNGLIEIRLEKNGKGFKLSVFNQCSGIICENEKQIWDVLYTTDTVRNSKDNSSGLGLAICKQIFDIHKFSYGYTNKNSGVEFYFSSK